MKVGEKPSFDEYFHFLDGKYKCLWTLEPMKSYGTNRPSLLRLYAIKLGPNCYLIVYGGIKLGDTIQNSPVLKDKVFNKIDNVLNYLKANGNRISGAISTTTKDYIINYQDLQGIGMTERLALPTLIALCSIALGKPTLSSLAVLGEISIAGTMLKVDELANVLQVCLDSGAKKVLLPITSAADLGLVPADLIGCFNLVFYQSAEDAVYKALGVE